MSTIPSGVDEVPPEPPVPPVLPEPPEPLVPPAPPEVAKLYSGKQPTVSTPTTAVDRIADHVLQTFMTRSRHHQIGTHDCLARASDAQQVVPIDSGRCAAKRVLVADDAVIDNAKCAASHLANVVERGDVTVGAVAEHGEDVDGVEVDVGAFETR